MTVGDTVKPRPATRVASFRGDRPVKLFLHVCCAPCLAKTLVGLRGVSARPPDLRLFFFNPNIHPLLEFRRRMTALRVYLEREELPAEIDGTYGLVPFLERLDGSFAGPERCGICLGWRMRETARRAKERGFDAFSTTLLASNEQDRDAVLLAAEAASAAEGIRFEGGDFRDAEVPEGGLKGIYRQSYCGCVFSEAERYGPTRKRLYG